MSAADIVKINRKLDAMEGQAQKLSDMMSDVLMREQLRVTESKSANDLFTSDVQGTVRQLIGDVQSSVSGTVASSLDVARAKLNEEMHAYVDAKIAEVIHQLDVKLARMHRE